MDHQLHSGWSRRFPDQEMDRVELGGRLGEWVALRIAVDGTGIPFVVQSNGDIYRRTSSDPTTGFWQLVPGELATDIGIGGDGSMWIITKTPAGPDFFIKKWNGSSWIPDSAGGIAVRIAVSGTGVPWVIQSNSAVYFRSSSDPNTGTWNFIGQDGFADIAVSYEGYGWGAGTGIDSGSQLAARDDQSAAGNQTPAEHRWRPADGAGEQLLNVAVGGAGDRPWYATRTGSIFRATK
jgi:hypothetical protein